MLIYCKVSDMQYVRKRENGADSVQPINVIDIRQDKYDKQWISRVILWRQVHFSKQ